RYIAFFALAMKIESGLQQEQPCPLLTLQRSTTASSDDHGPVRRIVCSRITFSDQVNVAPRFSKVLFTAAPPSLALFRLQPLHLARLKNTKQPAQGLKPVFGRFVSHGENPTPTGPGRFCAVASLRRCPAGLGVAVGNVTYISSSAKPSFCFARATARQYVRTACCFLSTSPLASTATQGRGSCTMASASRKAVPSLTSLPASKSPPASCWAMKTYPLSARSRREEELP